MPNIDGPERLSASIRLRGTGVSLALLALAGWCSAKVAVPSIFSDHAVLQRSEATPIWGNASPGESVAVDFGPVHGRALADAGGSWKIALDLGAVESGPFELRIRGKDSECRFSDILVGEAWLASGQSNMEFQLEKSAGAEKEILASSNRNLRVFTVQKAASGTPSRNCLGRWEIATPVSSGKFTAVGYYFGQFLQRETGRPVGIVHASWGGTPIEAWTSLAGLQADPELGPRATEVSEYAREFPRTIKEYEARFARWAAEYGRGDDPAMSHTRVTGRKPEIGVWREVRIPAVFSEEGLPDAGVVWLRNEVTMSKRGGTVSIDMGGLSGFYTVYLDGRPVLEAGPGTGRPLPGALYVPFEHEAGSKVVVAVRAYNPFGGAGYPSAGTQGPKINGQALPSPWTAWAERSYAALSPEAAASQPNPPQQPMQSQKVAASLFNGMIHPIVGYRLRGVLWYQGEENVSRAYQYRRALRLMINDWRSGFGDGGLPFLLCQLPNYGPKVGFPTGGAWPELREAQALAAAERGVELSCLIDLGEEAEIHPVDKRDVGLRLAGLALQSVYRKDMDARSPRFEGMEIKGSETWIKFSAGRLGLRTKSIEGFPNAPENEVRGFAIRGEDRQWVWASARLEGAFVVVSAPGVIRPQAVRYAWEANPVCNLYGGNGLPAEPFRTDDDPPATLSGRY